MAKGTAIERRPLMNAAEAADYLNTSERHVRRMVWERRIPKVKVGGKLRFDPVALDAWLADHATDADE